MKNKKLNNQYCINLDDENAALVEAIAQTYQRKPAELLRLLLVPSIEREWIKLQNQQHPENAQPLTGAIFKN